MRLFPLLLAAPLIGGCVTPPQVVCPPPKLERFAAIAELAPDRFLVALGPARLTAEDIECLARAGNKRAQYDLAKRLETSDGVLADHARAEALYEAAARTIINQTAIYVPPACRKCAGTVQFVRTGPDVLGLPDAALALARMHIEGRAAQPDFRRGLKMIDRLARRGYPPAINYRAGLSRRRA